LPEQGLFKVMTDQDLEQIRVLLRDALGPMQVDLAAVKTDLGGVKTDLAGVKTDLAAVKTDVEAQGAALAGVRTDVAAHGAALGAVRADVDAIKTEIGGWPDLHFLQAMAQQQIREADETREARRYMEIKLDEIYSSMATSSEIKRLATKYRRASIVKDCSTCASPQSKRASASRTRWPRRNRQACSCVPPRFS
jgi:hypothetical protein